MDLDGQLFWWFAGALVVAALIVSFVGIRMGDRFPGSGPVMGVVAVAMAALVVTTGAFGVALAREEKEHRDHEIEAAEHEAEAEEAAEGTSPGGSPSGEPPAESGSAPGGEAAPGEPAEAPAETLDVTSPEDGSLAFEPTGLEASAGTITLAYANPSSVPHNIALEAEGETLEESDTITESETEISSELAPGEYLYFCTVPGHREAGMEGTLTVQ